MRCSAQTLQTLSDPDIVTLATTLGANIATGHDWRNITIATILQSQDCMEVSANFYLDEFAKLAMTQVVSNVGIKILEFADRMRATLPAMRKIVSIIVNCGDNIDNRIPYMLEGGGVADWLKRAKVIGACSVSVPVLLNDMLGKKGVMVPLFKWLVVPVIKFHTKSRKNKLFATIKFLMSAFYGASYVKITSFIAGVAVYAPPATLAYAILSIYLKSRRSIINSAIAMLQSRCNKSAKECITECKSIFHDTRIPVEKRNAHRLVGVCIHRAIRSNTLDDTAVASAVAQELTPLVEEIDTTVEVLDAVQDVLTHASPKPRPPARPPARLPGSPKARLPDRLPDRLPERLPDRSAS